MLSAEEQYVSDLFHMLWTKAVGTEDYDKQEWKEFQRELLKRGIVT